MLKGVSQPVDYVMTKSVFYYCAVRPDLLFYVKKENRSLHQMYIGQNNNRAYSDNL